MPRDSELMTMKGRSIKLVLCAGLVFVSSGASQARILQPGEGLRTGETMLSEEGKYIGVMQHDGNFVVYSNDGQLRPIWSTNTTGRGAVVANMQRDGNFVLYDAAGRPVWWTASNGRDRTFAITEHGQAMVVAPGRAGNRMRGPGTSVLRRLGVKPVWAAKEYDRRSMPARSGPYCVGDPHACGKKLHGVLHHGP